MHIQRNVVFASVWRKWTSHHKKTHNHMFFTRQRQTFSEVNQLL